MVEVVDTVERVPVKVMLDVFVETVPTVEAGVMSVVEPNYLLSLYGHGHKHTSDLCFAVQIARRLLAEGGVSVFAISTYDTDYVLVKAAQWDMALDVLRQHHTVATGVEELLG